MAPPKRKRIPTRDTSNKRPKYTQPDTSSSSSDSDSHSNSDSEQREQDSQEEWEALRILEQTGRGFGVRFLIEWAGLDPATGKQWEPSWVKATNVSDGLRIAWREEQAQQAREKKEAIVAAKRRPPQQKTQPVSHSHTEGTGTSPSASEEVSLLENLGASVSDGTDPQVATNERSESPSRGEHELISEISDSQPSPSNTVTEETDLESSQLLTSQPVFRASGIVPDTQSSAGDVSYIPVTQEDLESSIYSESSDESGDHVVGYSVSEAHA